MLSKKQKSIKRLFDLVASVVILLILITPLILLIIIAAFSTRSSGVFVQQRIGLNGIIFPLYKIKTLKGKEHKDIFEIYRDETKFGSWLRKSKLDELPQLFNVINGTMSLVGPRPDVPGYADLLKNADRIILSIRPGITGPATIKYKNEDRILAKQENPNNYNDTVIWPDKIEINKAYVISWSFLKDIGYLLVSLR
ncbi:MAG: sugar transferase [Flavobacteriaceae bacterium]|nr:sugar transferase [Flavobacteriaceae bacterium]